MKIGRKPDDFRLPDIGIWYVGIEIRKCPPWTIGAFRPWIFIWAFKVLDHGEPGKLDGRPERKRGGYWYGAFPYSIELIITRH
jgi:hypothetical protein